MWCLLQLRRMFHPGLLVDRLSVRVPVQPQGLASCGKPGHYARDCSQTSYAPPHPEKTVGCIKPSRKMISVKSATTERGRVHHVSAKDAHDD